MKHQCGWMLALAVWALALTMPAGAAPSQAPAAGKPLPATADPAKADPIMGDYEGSYKVDELSSAPAQGRVVGLGGGAYRVMLMAEPLHEGDWPTIITLDGQKLRDEIIVVGKSMGRDWIGTIKDGAMSVYIPHIWGGSFELNQVRRESPTLGLKPPAGAVVLLGYDPANPRPPALDAWRNKNWGVSVDGAMVAANGNQSTVQEFGDCRMHVEFNVPYAPAMAAQGRGNSGVYLQERYEIQILDSYGMAAAAGDCGALYRWAGTRMDAQYPPLSWQTLDIVFRAPRLDAQGNVVEYPRMTVDLNGKRVHTNVELRDGTGGHKEGFVARDTIRLQDHGHAVRFRNMWLVEETVQ